jgi:DNA (cytosine-5)-methyltransferase 1
MDKDFSALRQDAGLNIRECRDILEVSVSTIYRYESGNSHRRVSQLQALRGVLSRKAGTVGEARKAEGWFSFIEFFAGIGGLRRGFESTGGKCVFTSEWDKHSQLTYRANF